MPKKVKEEEFEEVNKESEEESCIEQIADLTIEADRLKEELAKASEERDQLKKKYEDEHKANIRLMTRISDKEDKDQEEITKKVISSAKLSDLYDFNAGRIILK